MSPTADPTGELGEIPPEDGPEPTRFPAGRTLESHWRVVRGATFPTIGSQLRKTVHRVVPDEKLKRLAAQPLLSRCTRAELRRFAIAADEVEVPAGETLVHEGWISYWFFLVESGSADISYKDQVVAELGPGEHFGDVAILGFGPQPASIVAKTDIRLFVIGRREFLSVIDDLPGLQRALFVAMLRQLRVLTSLHYRALAGIPERPPEPARRGRTAPFPIEELDDRRPLGELAASLVKPPPVGVSEPPQVRTLSWRARSAITLVCAASALLVAATYHPPVLVVRPGAAFDAAADIAIEGVPVTELTGQYLVTPVTYERPTLLGAGLARFHPDHQVVRIRSNPGDAGPSVEAGKEEYRRAEHAAAAAAARSLGMNVTMTGTGAHIVALADGSTAAELLRVGDVIVTIDGKRVGIASDVATNVAAKASGSPFLLLVERDGKQLAVVITTAGTKRGSEGLGVVVETRDPEPVLPFDVRFIAREIRGPSAGLAYALAIADLLDPADLAQGRRIAATGTVGADGVVDVVGQVDRKGEVAGKARASLFFVPVSQLSSVGRQRYEVRGVSSLKQAIEVLRSPPQAAPADRR